MPRGMKQIEPHSADYRFFLQDIRAEKYRRVALIVTPEGHAAVYRFTVGRTTEWILEVKLRGRDADLWLGGKRDTGKAWRAAVHELSRRVP